MMEWEVMVALPQMVTGSIERQEGRDMAYGSLSYLAKRPDADVSQKHPDAADSRLQY